MLKLTVLGSEYFDEWTSEFVTYEDVELELEHSLVAVSKWESKFCKPFLAPDAKSQPELIGYFEAMVITPNFDPSVLARLTQTNIDAVQAYIDSPYSATTFGDHPEKTSRREIITSELIYYWMVAYSVPFECQHWHLNRLMALLRICNIKSEKPKKMSRHEIASRNRELNAQRRAALNSPG
jgi:hypothetical protein